MAYIDYELTPQQKEKIKDALGKRGAPRTCGACGYNDWLLVQLLSHLPLSPSTVLGGPTLPVAVLSCKKCGNIRMHSLVVLGLDLAGEQ